jgi:hypothetical protein
VVLSAQSEVLHRVAACPGAYWLETPEELCGCVSILFELCVPTSLHIFSRLIGHREAINLVSLRVVLKSLKRFVSFGVHDAVSTAVVSGIRGTKMINE